MTEATRTINVQKHAVAHRSVNAVRGVNQNVSSTTSVHGCCKLEAPIMTGELTNSTE